MRRYRPEDFEELYALDVRCFEPQFRFSRRLLRKVVASPEAVVLVARPLAESTQRQCLGFCAVTLDRSAKGISGYVATLDVDPAYRRQGIAQRLLLQCELPLQAAGVTWMRLHVWTENAGAIALYRASGYERVALVPDFYRARYDAWVLRKRIETAPA